MWSGRIPAGAGDGPGERWVLGTGQKRAAVVILLNAKLQSSGDTTEKNGRSDPLLHRHIGHELENGPGRGKEGRTFPPIFYNLP